MHHVEMRYGYGISICHRNDILSDDIGFEGNASSEAMRRLLWYKIAALSVDLSKKRHRNPLYWVGLRNRSGEALRLGVVPNRHVVLDPSGATTLVLALRSGICRVLLQLCLLLELRLLQLMLLHLLV